MVAAVAERLQVCHIEEVFAHRIRDNVIHYGGGSDQPALLAFSAGGELRSLPESCAEFRPAAGMVQVIGPLSFPVLFPWLHPIQPGPLHPLRFIHANIF